MNVGWKPIRKATNDFVILNLLNLIYLLHYGHFWAARAGLARSDKKANTPKRDMISYVHVQPFSSFLSKQFPRDGALREALLPGHPHDKSSSPSRHL